MSSHSFSFFFFRSLHSFRFANFYFFLFFIKKIFITGFVTIGWAQRTKKSAKYVGVKDIEQKKKRRRTWIFVVVVFCFFLNIYFSPHACMHTLITIWITIKYRRPHIGFEFVSVCRFFCWPINWTHIAANETRRKKNTN